MVRVRLVKVPYGGSGGLPPGFGLGKLRSRTGGPGGLLPVLGFRLGKLRYPSEGLEGLPLGLGFGLG